MVTLNFSTRNSTFSSDERGSPAGTAAIPDEPDELLEEHVHTELSTKTDPGVQPSERGPTRQVDVADTPLSYKSSSSTLDVQIERQKEAATLLVTLANGLLKHVNTIEKASQLQLLRRGLSRSHDILPSQSNYLSIVTLVEASIQSIDWKLLQKTQLQQVIKVLSCGNHDRLVTFDDYSSAMRQFHGWNLNATPAFDDFDFDFDFDASDVDDE